MHGLNIANSSSKASFDVDFLVGLDFYYIFITSNVKRDHFRELIAVESKLGWVLPESLKSNSIHAYLNNTCILRIKPQYQTFDESSDTSFCSFISDFPSNMHKEDKHFYGKFENNICSRG